MCGCSGKVQAEISERRHPKEVSQILNKWIVDNMGRKLLIQTPIYDIYNDIIGYITANESGNVVRIFKKNVKQVLD